jgi:Protein of unknwon function (DUF3008)
LKCRPNLLPNKKLRVLRSPQNVERQVLKGAAKEMYSSMSQQELEEFASTKRKGKPEHSSKSRSRS